MTLFVASITFSQEKVNVKETIGFGCYYAGQPTETVKKVTELLESDRYEKVSSLLNSKNIGEKYLAVISLQRLADMGKYQLNDTEMELIQMTKQSEALVSVCSGCTLFHKVPLKNLLAKRDYIGSGHWLDRSIKK